MKKISVLTTSDLDCIYEVFKQKRETAAGDFALAVVDSHGELLLFAKTDDSSVSSGAIAVNKAFTSARDRQKTAGLAAASAELGFAVSSLGDLRYTGLGGGVPITVDGDCIGAVAVSGMSQAEDEALAEYIIEVLSTGGMK